MWSPTVSTWSGVGRTSEASMTHVSSTESSKRSSMSAILAAASSSRSLSTRSSAPANTPMAAASRATPQTHRTTRDRVNSITARSP